MLPVSIAFSDREGKTQLERGNTEARYDDNRYALYTHTLGRISAYRICDVEQYVHMLMQE